MSWAGLLRRAPVRRAATATATATATSTATATYRRAGTRLRPTIGIARAATDGSRLSSRARWQGSSGFRRRLWRQTEFGRRVEEVQLLWFLSPFFRYGVLLSGAGAVGFVVTHIDQVPISGRWRFNAISDQAELEMSTRAYQTVLRQFRHSLVPGSHPVAQTVQRVMRRLIPASGLQHQKWEVHVVNAPDERNAFVLPGGKVFVFTGILPICQNDDGLATVLGHEIAHNVAHHAAERLTQSYWAYALLYSFTFFLGAPDVLSRLVVDYAFTRPGSRKQEAEANADGVMRRTTSVYY
ncbi:MAG: hypothetical protein M1826_005105 [Phylliscum demangeonii]|nr:MAG: hypothetical protein M1826_005105 [Phylliscum demangeonii]